MTRTIGSVFDYFNSNTGQMKEYFKEEKKVFDRNKFKNLRQRQHAWLEAEHDFVLCSNRIPTGLKRRMSGRMAHEKNHRLEMKYINLPENTDAHLMRWILAENVRAPSA